MSVLMVTAMDPDHVSSCDLTVVNCILQMLLRYCTTKAYTLHCTGVCTCIYVHVYYIPHITFWLLYTHSHTPALCSLPPSQGTHAEFSFSFENLLNESAPLPFEISHDRLSGEGTISVSDPLDFETTDRYVFSVSEVLVV